jgi:hypothetical protein
VRGLAWTVIAWLADWSAELAIVAVLAIVAITAALTQDIP